MKRMKAAVFLVCVSLLGVVSACSGEETSGEKEVNLPDVTLEEENNISSGETIKKEVHLDETEFVDYWGGNGTLMGFYQWMQETFPGAKVAVARVGKLRDYTGGSPFWESVESDGYFPFIPEEISPDSWMEISGSEQADNIWCVIPLDPLSSVTLTNGRGVVGEKPENARIALFCLSDEDEENGLQADIVSERTGETTSFLLNKTLNNLPMIGSVVDVTIKDGETPVPAWRLYGWWSAEEEFTDERTGEQRSLEHRVWFGPDGHFTQFGRQCGELAFVYEGDYSVKDGKLVIKMLGRDPEMTVPLELKDGKLRMNVDFLQKECDGTPLEFSSHTCFEPKTAAYPSCYAPVSLAEAFAKAQFGKEKINDCRCEIVDRLQTGLLVRCFSADPEECVSLGWWIINTEGPCYDYLTGDTLFLLGMEEKTEKGFVSAELHDGADVFVTFDRSPLLKAYVPKVKVGKKYPVEGLKGRILSLQIEYAQLDETPYLLIKEGDGGASICNLMRMTEDGKFVAHPIPASEPVIFFDVGEMSGGEAGPVTTIFAQLESGTVINALTGEYADFSPQSSVEEIDPDRFIEEVYPALECLQSCDQELFGAEIDESVTYSAGMTTVDGMQQVGVLYRKGKPLPEGYKEDPAYADYYPVKNFHTNEEVWGHLSHYLSEKVIQEVFHSDFLEYDGNLYLERGGRGYGTIVCEPDTAEYLREENGRPVLKIDYRAFGEYDHTAELYMIDTSEGWKIGSIVSYDAVG